MKRSRRAGLIAALGIAVTLLAVGCGGGGGGRSSEDDRVRTATIVSDLPLQGSSRTQSETIVNAINLAIEERGGRAGEVRIEHISQDDATAQAGKWDEDKCAENAQGAAEDKSVVGWIGPFDSGCARVQIPILNQANLAMVSPANTLLGLTKPGGEADEPERYYPTGDRNYARIIITDDKQGRAGAAWMRDLGVQSVYVLDDQEAYGAGLADQFQVAAEEAGIQVLGREGINGNAANYRFLMARIAQAQPDAVYFGGITQNNAGQLVNDKIGAGMPNEDTIFMGPDGIIEDSFLEEAGDAAEGVYVTFGGLPASRLSLEGQDFVQNYEDRFGGNIEAYTAYGYEAANVMLDAIERVQNADGEVTRENVLRELFATRDYNGVLGTWSFDADGDTTLTQLSGQRVRGGEFRIDKTIDAEGT
ncbi:MAG TPA: branched-chain amino acid ABC transporter substrate-binding protein [Rubrobacteraceae bacterium]|nr:branched-chain amino acid ABC transporter substrate-binding protein [Rubrobacteraceae bacterium]